MLVQRHRREGGSIITSFVNNSWYLPLDSQSVTENTSRVLALCCACVNDPILPHQLGMFRGDCKGYGPVAGKTEARGDRNGTCGENTRVE